MDQRWSEYQSRFSSLLQWSRQHTALMANKNFPQNPVELKVTTMKQELNCIFDLQCPRRSHGLPFLPLQALYNEYVHFKETEIPEKEAEKGRIAHLYKLLEVRSCEQPRTDEEVDCVCVLPLRNRVERLLFHDSHASRLVKFLFFASRRRGQQRGRLCCLSLS